MRRYHDIYDLPQQDYQDLIQGLPSALDDDPGSSKGLKTSLIRLFVARKILLCSLLALPSVSSVSDLKRWAVISDEIASLSGAVEISTTSLSRQIHEVSSRDWGDRRSSQGSARPDGSEASELVVPETPGKERVQAQLRRLNALSQSIRGLNARLLLMRDEADRMIGDAGRSSCLSSVLATQFDLIGVDLRNLITEWERGKGTMLLSVGSADPSSLSRPSSGLRSPQSPVQSLGGITAVNEGSPAEALKRLVGEGSQPPSNDGLGSDEDIFEAVSLPKPKCVSTTREEKLAKMQRDRQKRATLQENRDTTTSMLRELETVIKHRPRGRTTSRITDV
jgi:Mysoin-binding motif of peroxisomes